MVVGPGEIPTLDHRQDIDPFTVPFHSFSIHLTVQEIHEVTEILSNLVHVDLLVTTSQTTGTRNPLFQCQGHSEGRRESLEIHDREDGQSGRAAWRERVCQKV